MNSADCFAPTQVFALGNAGGLRVAVMDYGATPSVLQHWLRVAADQWLPVDARMPMAGCACN